MVKKITSLTGSGVQDWLIQQVTAALLAIYTLFLIGYLMLHSPLQYADWHALFRNNFMRICTFLVMFSIVYHTWVGLWTVFTDYIKCAWLRLTLQIVVILALLGFLVWGVVIVWN